MNTHGKSAVMRSQPSRSCGACQLCCEVLSIQELDKPGNTRCTHQATRGCAIYDSRPDCCRVFHCDWLGGALPKAMRPDRIGAVIWAATLRLNDGRTAIRMTKVSCSTRQKIDKRVLGWVEQASSRAPLFVEQGLSIYLYQDGKQVYGGRVGDRFDVDHDGKGKFTRVNGVPL